MGFNVKYTSFVNNDRANVPGNIGFLNICRRWKIRNVTNLRNRDIIINYVDYLSFL